MQAMLAVSILLRFVFTPCRGRYLCRAIGTQQIPILIQQCLPVFTWLDRNDTSRHRVQVNRLQIRGLRVWLSNQEKRFPVVTPAEMCDITRFVPVEVRWLIGGKSAEKDGATIAVPVEFINACAAGTMEAGAEPQGA